MENTTNPTQPQKDNTIVFYVLGGIIVTAIIVAGFLLYPKNTSSPTAQGESNVMGEQTAQPTTAPATKPISTLSCSQQFYNTVNGVSETYYLSTEGEAPTASGQVTCTTTASVNNQVVATDVTNPSMNASPERGGATFRCSTKGLKLKPGIPTKIVTDVKDAAGTSVSCSRVFLLP